MPELYIRPHKFFEVLLVSIFPVKVVDRFRTVAADFGHDHKVDANVDHTGYERTAE